MKKLSLWLKGEKGAKRIALLFILFSFTIIIGLGLYRGNVKDVVKPTKDKIYESSSSDKYINCTVSVKGLNDEVIVYDVVQVNKEVKNSAYDVLKQLLDKNDIEVSVSGVGSFVYVKGIGDLKEFDYGMMSGWHYRVNGIEPSKGAGHYLVNDGDVVEWYYVAN